MSCYSCRNSGCNCHDRLLEELEQVKASEARLGKVASLALHLLSSRHTFPSPDLFPELKNFSNGYKVHREDLEDILEAFLASQEELEGLIKPLRDALTGTEYLKRNHWWVEVDPSKGYDTVGNYMLFGNDNQARIPYSGWGKDVEKMGWVMYKRKTKE